MSSSAEEHSMQEKDIVVQKQLRLVLESYVGHAKAFYFI
jgi:hypothetical protein